MKAEPSLATVPPARAAARRLWRAVSWLMPAVCSCLVSAVITAAEPQEALWEAWSSQRETQLLEELAKGLGVDSYRKYVQALLRELQRRDETWPRPPEPAAGLLRGLLINAGDYVRGVEGLTDHYIKVLTRLSGDDLQMFVLIRQDYDKLRAEAAAAGALLPEAIAAKVRAHRADPGEKLYGGTPESSLTFDRELAARIEGFVVRQNEVFGRWRKAVAAYEKEAGKTVEDANAEATRRLDAFVPLLRNHHDYATQIEKMFWSRRYEHCLGVPRAPDTYSYSSPGTWQDPCAGTAELKDIPGMKIALVSCERLRDVFGPIRVPKGPAEPAVLRFYRNGPRTLQTFAEIQKIRLDAARTELFIETFEGPCYVVKSARDLGAGMIYGVVDPLKNFTDPNQSWDQAVYNCTKELTYDNVMNVTKAGCDLLDDLHRGVDTAGNKLIDSLEMATTDPAAARQALLDTLEGSRQSLQRMQDTLSGANPSGDPEAPPESASAQEWQAYGEALGARADTVSKAAQDVKAATDWYKAHVVDNAVRALTVYMAGKGAMESFAKVRSMTTNWDSVANSRVHWETAKQKVAAAQEIIARQKAGEPVPKDVLQLAEKNADPAKLARDQLQAVEREAKLQQIEADAAKQVAEESQHANRRSGAFEKSGALELEGGTSLDLGKKLGSGSFKDVFDHPEPNKVVQVIADPRRAREVLAREKMSTEHLDRAGVDHVQVFEEVATADGKYARVVERVDPQTMASNVLEKQNGKLTGEQQAALAETLDKLNDANMIWTDPNPGNFCFVRDRTGRLKAKIVDMDNVVDLKDPIAEGRTQIKLGSDAPIDLRNPAHVKALQRKLVAGDDMVEGPGFLAQAMVQQVGETLASQRYTGGKMVPGSMATLAKAVDPDFHLITTDAIADGLNKGVRAKVQEKLAGNSAYQDLVQQHQAAAKGVMDEAQALQQAAAGLQKRDTPAAKPPAETAKPGALQPLLLDAISFTEAAGMVEEFDRKLPTVQTPSLEKAGGVAAGDFLF